MLSWAQSTPTLCDAPDSIKALYQDDADLMALKQTLQQGTVWKDSVTINPQLSDSNMRALLAVYNATGLAARDTVINLRITNFPLPSMNILELVVDTNENWLQSWRNGNYANTGNPFVDSLSAKYGISTEPFRIYPVSTQYVRVVTTNYNLEALAEIMKLASGVIHSNSLIIRGGGDSISAIFNNNTALITYSHGWYIPTSLGCYTGCPYHRYWQFQVDLSDCSVQYLGSYGDVLPQNYVSVSENAAVPLQFYPNPFSEFINLENVALGTAFRLYAYNGQLVREGHLEQDKISNLQDLPAGVYLLKIGDGQQAQQVRLLKQ
jgi:hypothetical protein